MDSRLLTRASLGSIASLGDLYDARQDDFCGTSIFKKTIPSTALTIKDTHFTDVSLIHSDNYAEKFTKMDVSAELQVSVLAGLVTPQGSGKYLQDKKSSARTVKGSLIYNIKTKEESVNIYHEDLNESFAFEAIENGIATHVVVGISWGANSIISCFYENKENRDIVEIGGSLSAHLEKLKVPISGKTSTCFESGDKSSGVNFQIRVYGDILSNEDELPVTFQGAIDLMKKMPRLVATCNEGKGKPLTYRLLPVAYIQHYLNFENCEHIPQALEKASLTKIVHAFDKFSAFQQNLHDIYVDLNSFKQCIPNENLQNLIKLKNEIEVQESSFRSELSSLIKKVRSGEAEVSEVEAMLEKFQTSTTSSPYLESELEKYEPFLEQIELVKALTEAGAIYIGNGASLDRELAKYFYYKSIIFCFTSSARSETPQQWSGNWHLFFKKMQKKSESTRYYAVDCTIYPNLLPGGKLCTIQIIQSGRLITQDCLENREKLKLIPLAKSTDNTQRVLTKPAKLVAFKIACAGTSCNASVYEWTCKKCLTKLQYGDNSVFCNCGRSLVTALKFRCPDANHGTAFDTHDAEFLLQALEGLKPHPSGSGITLLLMGEKGVGKSTFINSFYNYVQFDTFDEAKEKNAFAIPSQFTVKYCGITDVVSTGKRDSDEDYGGTQICSMYEFRLGATSIKIIDTPGFSDTNSDALLINHFNKIWKTVSHPLKKFMGY